MKPFLAIVSGFVVSLGMFVGGLAFAVHHLAVEQGRQPGSSVDVADLWTAEPRRIDKAAQDLERIPAQSRPGQDRPVPPDATPSTGAVDAMTTAAVPSEAGEAARSDRLQPLPDTEQPEPADQLSAAHFEWCAARYRSYRPDDNSYTSYGGAQEPCVSPYSRDPAQNAEPTLGAPPSRGTEAEFIDGSGINPVFSGEDSAVRYAADDSGAYIGSDHASYCFSRYRSYRPEDNTYQPYGGGPRRQCR